MRDTAEGPRNPLPVPTSSSQSANLKRRRFLLTLGASGASAAVVANVPGAAAAPDVQAVASTEKQSGYRETKHIRDYYRTTKI